MKITTNNTSFLLFCFLQGQSQSSLQELKKENYFLKDYVHRLNSALNEYQAMYPTKSLTKDTNVCNLIY